MRRFGKYNAKKVTIDGIKFDSKAEGNRYLELKSLYDRNEIQSLQLQVPFELQKAFISGTGKKIRPITYIADFVYTENDQTVVEDCKGVLTTEYKLKKKLFQYVYYPLTIKETRG